MRLLLHSKTMALVRDMALPDGPTPRAGEVLAFPALAQECGGLHLFLVIDVCWLLVDGRLSPEITARATVPDATRLQSLQEMGWLAPAQDPAAAKPG